MSVAQKLMSTARSDGNALMSDVAQSDTQVVVTDAVQSDSNVVVTDAAPSDSTIIMANVGGRELCFLVNMSPRKAVLDVPSSSVITNSPGKFHQVRLIAPNTATEALSNESNVPKRIMRLKTPNTDEVPSNKTEGPKPLSLVKVCDSPDGLKSALSVKKLGKGIFSCPVCERRCHGRSGLARHERTHTGEKPYQCGFCEKNFAQTSHLNVHLRTHTGEKPFECSFCLKNFTTGSNLVAHMKIHTGERSVSCMICGAFFRNRTNLQTHMKSIHSKASVTGTSSTVTQPKSSSASKTVIRKFRLSKTSKFECPHCNVVFPSHVEFSQHEQKHFDGTLDLTDLEGCCACEFCGKVFFDSNLLLRHLKSKTSCRDIYKCAQCDCVFKDGKCLEFHKREHEGLNPYNCDQCEKSYRFRSSLIKHYRIHTGVRPFSCEICGAAFYESGHLTGHVKSVHTSEKPFKCECLKVFSTSSNFFAHLRRSSCRAFKRVNSSESKGNEETDEYDVGNVIEMVEDDYNDSLKDVDDSQVGSDVINDGQNISEEITDVSAIKSEN